MRIHNLKTRLRGFRRLVTSTTAYHYTAFGKDTQPSRVFLIPAANFPQSRRFDICGLHGAMFPSATTTTHLLSSHGLSSSGSERAFSRTLFSRRVRDSMEMTSSGLPPFERWNESRPLTPPPIVRWSSRLRLLLAAS